MAMYAALGVVLLSIVYLIFNYFRIKKMEEGNDEMKELALIIREGASTFLRTEYRGIGIVVIVLAVLLSLFLEKSSGLTFILGAIMSSAACIIGMRSATYANVRTANEARNTLSIAQTVKVALRGGSISGLGVQAFGLLGLVLVFILNGGIDPKATGGGFIGGLVTNPGVMRISSYSLGCSLVAMFNRVAGGNYTKAADISSDILAKIRHDMPEDDSRIPNVVADFIGDNVNDIAGNASDLLESFVATISASVMISVTLFLNSSEHITDATLQATNLFPFLFAGVGLLSCLVAIIVAVNRKMGDDPAKALNFATWMAAGLTILGGLVYHSLYLEMYLCMITSQ